MQGLVSTLGSGWLDRHNANGLLTAARGGQAATVVPDDRRVRVRIEELVREAHRIHEAEQAQETLTLWRKIDPFYTRLKKHPRGCSGPSL